ncbi:hypothetical protein Cgig2_032083 [Carnegiea gigantea]|uniref:Uncharacterized protein n=1 Tax=Carnegiea gigantea TaxID=171969 RepID=A0A9Q1JGU5_9CARY|nr:hypothetical protein Cgig2_032083 [Carnegiea gigantea]
MKKQIPEEASDLSNFKQFQKYQSIFMLGVNGLVYICKIIMDGNPLDSKIKANIPFLTMLTSVAHDNVGGSMDIWVIRDVNDNELSFDDDEEIQQARKFINGFNEEDMSNYAHMMDSNWIADYYLPKLRASLIWRIMEIIGIQMLVQDHMQACDNTRPDACESGEHLQPFRIARKNNGVLDSIL